LLVTEDRETPDGFGAAEEPIAPKVMAASSSMTLSNRRWRGENTGHLLYSKSSNGGDLSHATH
jgi:hypothetical protein